MKKIYASLSAFSMLTSVGLLAQPQTSGRLNESWQVTTLASALKDPWEIAWGPDNKLWVTEARGYKVLRVDPNTGTRDTVLRLDRYSTTWSTAWKPSAGSSAASVGNLNTDGPNRANPWPQGGMMGLAFHPDFNHPTTPKRFVYLAYVKSYQGNSGIDGSGNYFRTFLTRWTYNTGTQQLDNPVMICDTIPGSNDHNSGRLIVAPYNGINYLFYAVGDMGAGQFANASRAIRSQQLDSYQGKILRFNLEEDGDADQGAVDYNRWIPNDNPYNNESPVVGQSAVWNIGMRNNQGFAFANIAGVDRLYGSSHGPFSDDELNLILRKRNYGHPLVVGFADDGNYNNSKAARPSTSSLPLITSETANRTTINATTSPYTDPIFSWYAASQSFINNLYVNNVPSDNRDWPSEAPSGLDIYTSSYIPGWKNSLLSAMLKGHEPSAATPKSSPNIMRIKLNADGSSVVGMGTVAGGRNDTIRLYSGGNRFRDVAVSPDGRDIFVAIDSSSTTSGPTEGNPVGSTCRGCIIRFRFVGYPTIGGTSGIRDFIPIAPGDANNCLDLNAITINSVNGNNTSWMPITDENGNIVAEINANGNNLGLVIPSLYKHSGSVRIAPGGTRYVDRNLSIEVQNQPSPGSPVDVRLYFTTAEYNAIVSATSGLPVADRVTAPTQLRLYKTNSSNCQGSISQAAVPVISNGVYTFGTSGYVIDAEVSSFSSFFVAKDNVSILPVTFTYVNAGWLGNLVAVSWNTADETEVARYVVERGTNGQSFTSAGEIQAKGNSLGNSYYFKDQTVGQSQGNRLFYRIRVVNKDGSFAYSKTVSVSKPVAETIVRAYPNPTKGELMLAVESTADEAISLSLVDASGRVAISKNQQLTRGENRMMLDLNSLPAGVYQLQARCASFTKTLKVMKL